MKDWRLPGSRLFFLLFVALVALPGSAQKDQKPKKLEPPSPPTWVELGENGAIIARQVLEYQKGQKPKCPSVDVGKGKTVAMAERGGLPKGFGKVVVCEAVIPSGTTSASIKKIELRLPDSSINKIVLVGDTGCKGIIPTTAKATPLADPDDEEESEEAAAAAPQKTKKPQKCGSASHWPLANVAEYARKKHPDLVIHVGDYVYVREDTWENWKAQFFQPAQPLLLAAPWIFVRGNHENCALHGNGFFYLLDPRAPNSCPDPPQTVPSCPKDNVGDSTSPYVVKVGGSQFVVMDSSGANCDFADKECAAHPTPGACFTYELNTWKDLFSQANQLLGSGNAFLLTHRPLWGLKSGTSTPPPPPVCPGAKGETAVAINSTLQAAYEQSGMKGINMVLSGHIHNFQLITYNPASGISPQPQLVVGDSGVKLSTPPPQGSACNVIAHNGFLERSTLYSGKEFGFGVLTSDASKFDLYLPSGDLGLNCTIVNNTAKCVPPAAKKKNAGTASAKKK